MQRAPPPPPQHLRGDHRSQVKQVRAENELRDIRVMTQPVMVTPVPVIWIEYLLAPTPVLIP